MKLINTFSTAILFIFVMSVLGVAYYAHSVAGFGLPPPWWDEGQFLWPADSIANHNTLFTEHLNPNRPIFLMLMGYSVIMGLIFKVVPFSIEAGRLLSFAWITIAAFLFGSIARRWSIRWLVWSLISLFTISRPFVVAGNIVRPEAFCWLLVVGAMATANVRPWLSLSILFLMPLIHPNGVWFAAAGVGATCLTWSHMKRRFHKSDWIWFSLVCFGWITLGAHAAFHWHDFMKDISFSLFAYPESILNKFQRLLLNPEQSPYFFVALGLVLYWRKQAPNRCWMAILSATMLAVPALRIQMWYAVFSAAGQMVSLSLLLLWISERPVFTAIQRRIALAVLFLLAGWHLHRAETIAGPRGYPYDMTWGWGMITENKDIPYITDQDRAAVAAELLPLMSSDDPKRVNFLPDGDAFFFMKYAEQGLIGYQPAGGAPKADYYVVHDTRYLPPWTKRSRTIQFENTYISRQIRVRSATESWVLICPLSTNNL